MEKSNSEEEFETLYLPKTLAAYLRYYEKILTIRDEIEEKQI